MFDLKPFTPANKTAALTVGTTATAVTLPLVSTSGNSSGAVQVVLTNVGTNVVFVAWAPASAVAVAPVSGTPANGFPLLPNSQKTVTVPDGFSFSAIAAATGNTLYLSPGSGA